MDNILAERIQNNMKNLLGHQVSVLDAEGTVLSSGFSKLLGNKLPISPLSSSTVVDIKLNHNNETGTLIPIINKGETEGLLLIHTDQEKISGQLPLVKSLAELLAQQYYDSIKPDLDSTDKFICQLLYNKDPNQLAYLASQARILGYRLDVPRMAFLIHMEGFWRNYLNSEGQFSDEKESIIMRKKRDLETTISGFFTKDTDNITAYMGEDKFVIFKDIKTTSEDQVNKLLKRNFKSIVSPMRNFNISSISAGIGRGAIGIAGLIRSCKEADTALVLGKKMWGDNRVYSFDELGLISIIGQGNKEKKLHFSDQILHDLNNNDLLKTLECFFEENLNLTQTAERLGIHRNTVIYRLDQISKILNRDPRQFDEAVEVKIALLIRRLLD